MTKKYVLKENVFPLEHTLIQLTITIQAYKLHKRNTYINDLKKKKNIFILVLVSILTLKFATI